MIGTEIGTYRILDKLGDGGMGVVYKAVDTQLDRVVAVKALSPELSGNPMLVERFRIEARAQAQLNHPNLATLYAFLVQESAAYMVMEFVDGETFHGMIMRRGPIPAEEAVLLFRQALAGIGHAHRMGIVHRDIKPSNIMLNRDGIVKVMDFGLAKVGGSHGVTRTGVRLGTAYYMSPEQVLVKPVDVRSDIYSLGVTLYEMLTGQAPFQADSEFEILNDHVNTPPPPPSRFCPQIPRSIEDAVLKALAKDPDQRFQNVEQFSAALEHPAGFYSADTVVDEAPVPPDRQITVVAAPPVPAPAAPAPPDRPVFWTGQRKLLAGTGAALVCLLAAWLIFHPKPRPQPAAQPPVQPPIASQQPAPAPPVVATPAKPVQPARVVVPADTVITVVTVEAIDPKAGPDREFHATLAIPVTRGYHVAFRQDAEVVFRMGEDRILELASIGAIPVKGTASLPTKKGAKELLERAIGKNQVPAGTKIDFTLTKPVSVPLPH